MADHDDGSTVIIRLRDVYEIAKRTEEKVDLVAYSVGEKLPDHESRLRSMEKRVWAIPSLSAIIAVISLVVALHQHSGTPTRSQSAPLADAPQTVVSAAPRSSTTTTPTTAPAVVQVSERSAASQPRTTSAAPTTTTAPPTTAVTTPPAAATLVDRIANLTSTVDNTVTSLTKGN